MVCESDVDPNVSLVQPWPISSWRNISNLSPLKNAFGQRPVLAGNGRCLPACTQRYTHCCGHPYLVRAGPEIRLSNFFDPTSSGSSWRYFSPTLTPCCNPLQAFHSKIHPLAKRIGLLVAFSAEPGERSPVSTSVSVPGVGLALLF